MDHGDDPLKPAQGIFFGVVGGGLIWMTLGFLFAAFR